MPIQAELKTKDATLPQSKFMRANRFQTICSAMWKWTKQEKFLLSILLFSFAALCFLPEFRLNLLAKYLTFAIVALAIDLIWGYGGMLCLGQGVFFGLGAYILAMHLKLVASGNSLPDFMSWSGLDKLPLVWQPFYNPYFAIFMAMAIPMTLAASLGWLIFHSRIKGVYFSIVTQALALIMVTLFIGQQAYTGGTNGITNFTTLFCWKLADPYTQKALFVITVICLCLTYLFCNYLVKSRYGRSLMAIREDEERLRFLGYDIAWLKTIAFVISAGLAALAGMLFVLQVGLITPSMMGIIPSAEMVIYVALGGRGTLIGAVLGALVVSSCKTLFSESFPDVWPYLYGILICAIVFFPNGLIGAINQFVLKGMDLVNKKARLSETLN